MKTLSKKIISLFLALTMVFSLSATAFAASPENRDFANLLQSTEIYINPDTNLFDIEKAEINNENKDIISIGLIYNKMLLEEQQGNYKRINRVKHELLDKLTHYGNWCGKGNNGKPPIDILDSQCKKHDYCYSCNGMWNTECDKQFVYNIAQNFKAINKLGKNSRNYAIAAVLLFSTKIGGTEVLKLKYPLLAKFLP